MKQYDLWLMDRTSLLKYASLIYKAENKAVSVNVETEDSDILGYTVDSNGDAHINIKGMLSPEGPSGLDKEIGIEGTSYTQLTEDILSAHANLEADRTIFLHVDSPGGTVTGIEDAAYIVTEVSKERKVVAINEGIIASGAIWLTAGCTEIKARRKTVAFGSVGVVISLLDMSKLFENIGIKLWNITNTESPKKRSDVTTEEGRGVIVAELDGIYDMFLSTIFENRSALKQQAVKDLQGSIIWADAALKVGFCDSIMGYEPIKQISSNDIIEGKGEIMNVKELQEKHPELFSQVKQMGADEEKAAVSQRLESVRAYMEVSTYSDRVKLACAGVVAGTRDIEGLKDLIALEDQLHELKASESDEKQEDVENIEPEKLAVEKTQRELDAMNDRLREIL